VVESKKRENNKRSNHDTVIDYISHVTAFSGNAGHARGRSLHRHIFDLPINV